MDSPEKLKSFLGNLGSRERAIFDLGYAIALEGVLEQICDSKSKLLAKMMWTLDQDEHLEEPEIVYQLLAKITLLDVYEKHYGQRAKMVAQGKDLQTFCASLYA